MGGRGNFSGGTFKTTDHSLTRTGTPNSRVLQYKKGNLYMERRYGADGWVDLDIDYTDHGNPKEHPKVPHKHPWIWINGKKTRIDED